MSAMVVVIITTILPILVSVVISVTRLHLHGSSQQESRKENGHYQQHSAVIPQYIIFHVYKLTHFKDD